MNIVVRPAKTFRIIMLIVLFLMIAHFTMMLYRFYVSSYHLAGIVRLFNLDEEINIPTFYQAVTLLLCSILLWYVAGLKRSLRREYIAWSGLAVVFMFLAIDEASMIHETLSYTFRTRLHTSGYLYDAWVIPYAVLLLIGAALYIPFFLKLPRRTLVLFALSFVFYVGGAMIVELFEGKFMEIKGTNNPIFFLFYAAIEEFGEMFGVAIFIYALLDYISGYSNQLILTVSKAEIERLS